MEETKNTDDPLFNFFMSMYQLTKTMPHHYQHRVRAQVFQAVSDAEAEVMNITFNRPPSTTSYESSASSIQHMAPIHHAHQMERDPENLPSSQPNSSSLTYFISNYQCDNELLK